MASVHAVAEYVLGKSVEETGESITSSKLQNIVFLCQLRNLALHGEPLFDEQVQTWGHGPGIMTLHMRFKDYGDFPIDISEIGTDSQLELSIRDRDLVDEVWASCGLLSESQLRNLDCHEGRWRA